MILPSGCRWAEPASLGPRSSSRPYKRAYARPAPSTFTYDEGNAGKDEGAADPVAAVGAALDSASCGTVAAEFDAGSAGSFTEAVGGANPGINALPEGSESTSIVRTEI